MTRSYTMPSKVYDHLTDKEKLYNIEKYYVKEKLSFSDIAKKFETYANKIRRDAKKFGIQIRNKSEAQSNAIKTGKHKHPTKGQKRDEKTKNKIGMSVMKAWDDLDEDQILERKAKSKLAWEKLDKDHKENMLSLANKAVRQSSKTGSKLEKFILEALLENGYVVEFHKEQILSNTKLQIDLFLPILNIAIEVDGPSHFEPVWGTETLQKNKKYDKKKTGLILGKGLKLIRIKQNYDYSKSRARIVYGKLLEAIKEMSTNSDTKSIDIQDTLK